MEKAKTQCFIHEKIRNYKKADICAKVCNDLHADYSYNGQSYCILHLPDENKDKSIFIREFNRKVEEENYSFCGVYFPIYVEFESECFESEVDFRSATFTKSVSFIKAKFKENALFSWAKFESDTFFDFVAFNKEAKFDSAIFAKDSDTLFRGTIFNGLANFSYATFNGFIEFGFKHKKSSNLNYDKRPIIEKNNQPNDIQVTFFKSGLKLEHIRLESSNKIIFHSIRLRPSWFVNSDVTEFILTFR